MELSRHLRPRACPVCGNTDTSHVAHPTRLNEAELGDFAFASRKFPEFMHLQMIRCPECSVIYVSPALSPEFLSNAYRDAAYDSVEEANYAARTYAGVLKSFVSDLGDREVALEVGSGNGAFLPYLQAAGFRKVIGIEPSLDAIAAADPSVKPLIRTGMFVGEEFEPASVSLVSCFQTIEHLENPRSFCSDAFHLLRPGGAIFLIGHDYNSWVTQILGERSPIFDVEHFQLFSQRSLRYMLEACGYRDVRIGTLWNVYPLNYWLKLLPVPIAPKRAAIAALRTMLVGRLPLPINIGNLYAVAFRR